MPRPQSFPSLARRIRLELLDGPGTPRLPGERELAVRYGTSRPTIRKALTLLAGDGLIDRRHGLATARTRPLTSAQRTIAYVGETGTHFHQDFFLALTDLMHVQGHRLVPLATDRDPTRLQRLAEELPGCDAILASTPLVSLVRNANPTATLVAVGLHRFDLTTLGSNLRCVWGDRRRAVEIATHHVITRGHQRIAYLGARSRADLIPGMIEPAEDALFGFRCALLGQGLSETCHAVITSEAEERDRELASFLIAVRKSKATAVVCDMDYTASLLVGTMRAAGLRIPRDLAVTGVGNTPWCDTMRPALTTVDYRHQELAMHALAACVLPPPMTCEAIVVEPRLVVRASSGPAQRR
jgi:DNA-binding LacI/PurR family transcriptional regulator